MLAKYTCFTVQWVVVKSRKVKHSSIFWPKQCVACECHGTGEGHRLLIDFKAYKEKLLREELDIADLNDPAKTVTLVFHARVLGMSAFLCTTTNVCWAFSVADLMVGCQQLQWFYLQKTTCCAIKSLNRNWIESRLIVRYFLMSMNFSDWISNDIKRMSKWFLLWLCLIQSWCGDFLPCCVHMC